MFDCASDWEAGVVFAVLSATTGGRSAKEVPLLPLFGDEFVSSVIRISLCIYKIGCDNFNTVLINKKIVVFTLWLLIFSEMALATV